MVTESQAEELAEIACFEVMPGWDTLNGYIILKGSVPYGYRTIGAARATEHAKKHLAISEMEAAGWALVDVGPEEPTEAGDMWRAVRPIGDTLGMGAPLAALAETEYPAGEWRMGRSDLSPYRVGGTDAMVVRVLDGEVVAMVAPVVRES